MTEIVNPRAILAGIRQAIDDMMEGGDIHVTTAGVRIDLRGLLGDCDLLRQYILIPKTRNELNKEYFDRGYTAGYRNGYAAGMRGRPQTGAVERQMMEEEDRAVKRMLDAAAGCEKVAEEVGKHIRDRIEHGTADPEINAIREGTKGTMGVSEPIQREPRGELSMVERLEKIDVMCRQTGQVLDVAFAAKDRVRWSCPCGHQLELPNYVVDSLANHATEEPSVIFTGEECRRKDWP